MRHAIRIRSFLHCPGAFPLRLRDLRWIDQRYKSNQKRSITPGKRNVVADSSTGKHSGGKFKYKGPNAKKRQWQHSSAEDFRACESEYQRHGVWYQKRNHDSTNFRPEKEKIKSTHRPRGFTDDTTTSFQLINGSCYVQCRAIYK